MPANAWDIARAFSRQLHATLTKEQMDEVNARNTANWEPQRVCHSHDFCDANQCMIDALDELGVPHGHIASFITPEVDEGWNIAKECEYDLEEINALELYYASGGHVSDCHHP